MLNLMRGALPSPRHRLCAATPHAITATPAPSQFLWKPTQLSMWGNATYGDCTVAEEAFSKGATACIFIPDDTVVDWAQQNGAIDGDTLIDVLDRMQVHGFELADHTYDDGPSTSVDWTNAAILQSAIAQGPVKIGIAADQLQKVVGDPPANGWLATDFTQDQNMDHCVSLAGYGSIQWLADQLESSVPSTIDNTASAYALFTWGSIGIIDVPSMLAITGEAWLRNPTTVVK